MINRRHDDRASCPARQSLKQTLERKPRIHSPASGKGGHESGSNLTLGTRSGGPLGVEAGIAEEAVFRVSFGDNLRQT
jgi:hypothetical protein